MINLLERLNDNSKYVSLVKEIESNKNCSCFGLNFNEISFILSFLKKQKILVVNSVNEAYKYEEQLKSLNLKTFVLLNKIENFSYSYFNVDENLTNFIVSCYKLKTKEIDVLIVLNNVLMQKFISPLVFEENIVKLKVNSRYNFNELINLLIKNNYKKVDEIENKGEFNYKGDILNIFPINLEYPVRVSFFDDEIEYIKSFSLQTYEVLNEEKSINICPNTICFYDDEDYQNILNKIDENIKNSETPDKTTKLNSLKNEIENRPNSQIHSSFILPFLKCYNASLLDYLDGVVIYTEPKIVVDSINNEYVNFLSNLNEQIYEGRLLNEHKNIYLNKNDVFKTKNTNLAFLNLNTSNKIFNSDKVYSFLSSYIKNYNYNYNFLIDDLQSLSKNYCVILCSENSEKALKLQEFLNEKTLYAKVITSVNQIKEKGIYVLISNIYQGVNLVEDKVLILGNFNIYGTKKVEVNNQTVKKVFFTPKLGDYCVHEIFGICKCKSLEKVSFNGVERDYIVLEFFGGDTLFLPGEKADLITKYIGNNENPKLNKLGTTDFIKEKIKVKNKVKTLAFDLLELYAKRENSKGFKFKEDDELQASFENAFPFPLTEDQQKAVDDIKKDMQSDKTMDRLVCGDVGYGKTEVAMRAIFKAIISGKQVAFLCPTTILSEQHYKTCLARMNDFMVNVKCLNRFKSNIETKEILKDLESGKIELICGTHRLLSKDVKFKNLGLLVLDEEQRFGVEDKEKIKNLKENIDVLTLSATPIPRTLNMSLIGVRDISIIDTPPKNRIPVQSFVTEYSPSLVKDAITKELNRGGQVLIVYNRVESISQYASTIRNYFPNVNIAVAHGQMEKKELEKIINRVYDEEVQILISTVLIENGIDLPKANTIIIVNADKLGLSQLYQLRGRVGRSNVDAYAYFTYMSNLALTEEGYKRLSALSEFSGLGSGFKIAMRDLEIRGAGSILGKEQSGHIEKVGYDMYTKLLKETVSELKGNTIKEKRDCKIDVNLNCFISKDYIESDEVRIKCYEEISNVNSIKEKEELLQKFNDKYGKVENSIVNLINVALVKNLLLKLDAKRLVINNDNCFIEFYDKNDLVSDKINEITKNYKKVCQIKLNVAPKLEFSFDDSVENKLKSLINILTNNKK